MIIEKNLWKVPVNSQTTGIMSLVRKNDTIQFSIQSRIGKNPNSKSIIHKIFFFHAGDITLNVLGDELGILL